MSIFYASQYTIVPAENKLNSSLRSNSVSTEIQKQSKLSIYHRPLWQVEGKETTILSNLVHNSVEKTQSRYVYSTINDILLRVCLSLEPDG